MERKSSLIPGITAVTFLVVVGSFAFFLALEHSKLQNIPAKVGETSVLNPIENSVKNQQDLSQAELLLAQGQLEQAALIYADQAQKNPSDPKPFMKLAQIKLQLGKTEEALKWSETALQLASGSEEAQALHVRALFGVESWDGAQKALDGMSDGLSKKYLGALLQVSAGQGKDAEAKLRELAKQTGAPKGTTFLLAAYDNFAKGLEGQTIYRDTLLSKALIEAAEPSLAIRLAKNVLNQKTDYRDAWILLGYANLQKQSWSQAEDALKTAVQIDPLQAQAHYLLGLSREAQSKYPEAIKDFELAILHHHKPIKDAYVKLAENQSKAGHYEDAVQSYEQLLTLGDAALAWYVNPVWISLDQLHDPLRARSLAEQAVLSHGESAQSHSLLAWVLVESNELDEAVEEVNKAFRLDNNLADTYYVAGLLEERQKNLETAKDHYKKAYEKSPQGSTIWSLAAKRFNILSTQTIQK